MDGAHIFGQHLVAEPQEIAHAQFRRHIGALSRQLSLVHDGEGSPRAFLPGEQIGNGLHRGGLEILVFELEFHYNAPSNIW